MSIEVKCSCGQSFQARDELAGQQVKCPVCKASLTIAAPKKELSLADLLEQKLGKSSGASSTSQKPNAAAAPRKAPGAAGTAASAPKPGPSMPAKPAPAAGNAAGATAGAAAGGSADFPELGTPGSGAFDDVFGNLGPLDGLGGATGGAWQDLAGGPAMGAPGMGAPGMGAPGLGAPGLGAPGMSAGNFGAGGFGAAGFGATGAFPGAGGQAGFGPPAFGQPAAGVGYGQQPGFGAPGGNAAMFAPGAGGGGSEKVNTRLFVVWGIIGGVVLLLSFGLIFFFSPARNLPRPSDSVANVDVNAGGTTAAAPTTTPSTATSRASGTDWPEHIQRAEFWAAKFPSTPKRQEIREQFGVDAGDYGFLVHREALPPGVAKAVDEEALKEVVEAMRMELNGTLLLDRPVKVSRGLCREFKLTGLHEGQPLTMFGRVYVLPNAIFHRNFAYFVTYAGIGNKYYEADGQRFVASFRFLDEPSQLAPAATNPAMASTPSTSTSGAGSSERSSSSSADLPSGWSLHASQAHRYEVGMPGTPAISTANAAGLVQEVAALSTVPNVFFSVAAADAPSASGDRREAAKTKVSQLIDTYVQGMMGMVQSEGDVEKENALGRQVVFYAHYNGNEQVVSIRGLATDTKLYLLTCMAVKDGYADADVQRFFDSFRMTTPSSSSPASTQVAKGSLKEAGVKWLAAVDEKTVGAYRYEADALEVNSVGWMVQLLPYLNRQSLYDQFNLKKSVGEQGALARTEIPEFLDPADPNRKWDGVIFSGFALTHFVGMAGIEDKRTDLAAKLPRSDPRAGIFGYDGMARLSDITDGTSQTIMLIGNTQLPGPWAAGGGGTIRGAYAPYFEGRRGFRSAGAEDGVYVLMADGSFRELKADMDPKLFRAMCTTHGSDSVDMDALPGPLEAIPNRPVKKKSN